MDTNFSQPSTPTVNPVLDHNKMFDLAEQLITLRDDKDKLEDRLKKLNTFIEEIEFKLSDAMALSETQNFTRSGKTFYLTTKTRASAAAESKESLFNALRKEGFGALVYETVNANSLSSFVKEQIGENEGSLPEWLRGLVNVFEKTTVGVRKASKEKHQKKER